MLSTFNCIILLKNLLQICRKTQKNVLECKLSNFDIFLCTQYRGNTPWCATNEKYVGFCNTFWIFGNYVAFVRFVFFVCSLLGWLLSVPLNYGEFHAKFSRGVFNAGLPGSPPWNQQNDWLEEKAIIIWIHFTLVIQGLFPLGFLITITDSVLWSCWDRNSVMESQWHRTLFFNVGQSVSIGKL
jgi:hypothetical protein